MKAHKFTQFPSQDQCSHCMWAGNECPTKEDPMKKYRTIQDIKRANHEWAITHKRVSIFDRGAMVFFSSQVHDKVYGGRYFITSEQFIATDYGKTLGFKDGDRLYTVRECRPDGSCDTIGEFQAYKSIEDAERYINSHLLAN